MQIFYCNTSALKILKGVCSVSVGSQQAEFRSQEFAVAILGTKSTNEGTLCDVTKKVGAHLRGDQLCNGESRKTVRSEIGPYLATGLPGRGRGAFWSDPRGDRPAVAGGCMQLFKTRLISEEACLRRAWKPAVIQHRCEVRPEF
jgi:hypothetical protein